jgi:hypothetical protein
MSLDVVGYILEAWLANYCQSQHRSFQLLPRVTFSLQSPVTPMADKRDKNGGKCLVPTAKAPRFYPAEDVRQPKKSRKSPRSAPVTPGTILILLAGRYREKRVIFLKQLASGLFVNGPFKVNDVHHDK